jgi:hypothetical protein
MGRAVDRRRLHRHACKSWELHLDADCVRRRAHSQSHSGIEEELTFDVSALDGHDPKWTEHLKWLSKALHVGDSISIRIVEVEAADPPVERYRDDPEAVERAKRRYFDQMKREYDR